MRRIDRADSMGKSDKRRDQAPMQVIADAKSQAAEMTVKTKTTISAIIITCDDADVVEACLQSVSGWVDEIVVVDMHSTDGTREIVQRYTDRLLNHERLPFADPMREWAHAQVSGNWTLLIDPDERVPTPLAAELRRIADEDSVDVVMIPFRTMMFGKVLESPGGADASHPRLFRTGAYIQPEQVHTGPDLTGKQVLHLPERGRDFAIHHNTWRTASQVVDKLMRYAPEDAAKLRDAGVKFSAGNMVRDVVGEVVGRCSFGRIYEDGISGLLVAFYFAFYKLAIHTMLWEMQGQPRTADQRIRRKGKHLSLPLKVFYKLFLRHRP